MSSVHAVTLTLIFWSSFLSKVELLGVDNIRHVSFNAHAVFREALGLISTFFLFIYLLDRKAQMWTFFSQDKTVTDWEQNELHCGFFLSQRWANIAWLLHIEDLVSWFVFRIWNSPLNPRYKILRMGSPGLRTGCLYLCLALLGALILLTTLTIHWVIATTNLGLVSSMC